MVDGEKSNHKLQNLPQYLFINLTGVAKVRITSTQSESKKGKFERKLTGCPLFHYFVRVI